MLTQASKSSKILKKKKESFGGIRHQPPRPTKYQVQTTGHFS